jgi:hypothetical protein
MVDWKLSSSTPAYWPGPWDFSFFYIEKRRILGEKEKKKLA